MGPLAAGLLAAGTIGGGLLSSGSASSAADAAQRSAEAAAAEQRRQFDLTRRDLGPARRSGARAGAALDYELGLGPMPQRRVTRGDFDIQEIPAAGGAMPANALAPGGNMAETFAETGAMPTGAAPAAGPRYSVNGREFDTRQAAERFVNRRVSAPGNFNYRGFQETPGFDYRLNEALEATEGTLAAAGMAGSGAAARELMGVGMGMASQEYDNYLNRLSAAAGRGQSVTNTLAGARAGMASNVGNLLVAGGNVQAGALANQGNIMSQTLGQLGGIAGRYFATPGAPPPNALTTQVPQYAMPGAFSGGGFNFGT